VSISTAGDNTVITTGSGEMPAAWDNGSTYIAIDSLTLVAANTVTVQLKSGSTNYGGAMTLIAGVPLVIINSPRNEHGIITLAPNQNFVINLGGAVQVSGFVRYRVVATN